MSEETTTALTAAERAVFADCADVLIPAAAQRLSASQAGIAGPLLDEIAGFVPERLELLRRVVEAAARRGAGPALEALKAKDPAAYDSFCETVAAAYFMAPEVRETVGFPGRVPVPARTDVAELEGLLLPVLEAGFTPRGYEG